MALFGFLNSDYELVLEIARIGNGVKKHQYLDVSHSVAIPTYWVLLHKKGNSNTREQIGLMKRFIKQFDSQNIIRVLADREFIGSDWLTWLQSRDIDFGIRIKKDAKIPNAQDELVRAEKLFLFLKVGEQMFIDKLRRMHDRR